MPGTPECRLTGCVDYLLSSLHSRLEVNKPGLADRHQQTLKYNVADEAKGICMPRIFGELGRKAQPVLGWWEGRKDFLKEKILEP